MTQGMMIFFVGLGIIGVTILLFLILNIVYAVQRKKIHKIIQDDYSL